MRKGYNPCPDCGKPKARHAFRCRACSPLIRGEAHYAWKGDDARAESKRHRSANAPRSGPCEECGEPGRDRHHKDGDPGNNAAENIAWLCRRCHMQADGRLEALRLLNYPTGGCRHCGREPYPGFRHGNCGACRRYWERTGRPRPVELIKNGRVCRLPDPPKPCVICERPMKPLRKGRCGACNEYLRRNGHDRVRVTA